MSYKNHYNNPDGRRRRLSVGTDYQLAQRQAVRFTEWLLAGKEPERELKKAQQLEKAKNITVREFYPIFIKRYGSRQSKSMQELYYYYFKNISRCPAIVDSAIESISKSKMLDYMQLRMEQDGVKTATVNREASFVKCMLSRAVEWDILDRNPLSRMKLFKEAEKREVNFTPKQAASLLDELPSSLGSIVEFAIYSGFRKENILDLRIESIQFFDIKPEGEYMPEGEVELIVKGGRREKFPLGAQAVKVLKKAIGNRTFGYVFINPDTETRYKSINKTFDRAVRRLNLTVNGTKLRFHDLRHVFASWLLMAGVSLDMLRPLLGHRDRKTTDRYATIDRLAMGRVLKVMPSIRGENESRKMASNG